MVKVIDYFDITGWGPIALLQHQFNGLAVGTILKSPQHNHQWRVKARLLFMHSASRQNIFENESVEYLHMGFKNLEALEKSLNEISEKEARHIYQYMVEAVSGHQRMKAGDELLIILP